MTSRRLFAALSAIALFAVFTSAAMPAHAVKVGPVDDPLGVVKINKGQPIVIGGTWVLSGADTALGLDSKRGAEVYLSQINNTMAGHPIRFTVEDDGCNAEGGQLAGTKLAANQQMVAVLGSACSSVCTVTAPILWKQGIPQIGTACSAPRLVAPDRGPSFDGFLRTISSDGDQPPYEVKWFMENNNWKKVATIHDGSPYAQQLVAVFEAEFKKKGGTITASEAVSPTDVDMRPVLTRIAASKPDVVYYPIFVAAAGHITRQAREIAGLTKVLIGGGSMMTKDMITAAGDAVVGFRITMPDVSKEALGKDYPDLVKKYKTMFGEEPIQGFHAQAYDAARMLHMAIEKVAVKDKDSNTYIGRRALRDALFNTPAFDGVAGRIKCTPTGQCLGFKYAVYEFTSADSKTFDVGKNPKKIYAAQ
jgi:branched-chain amino acid transport system substrate-binding protein